MIIDNNGINAPMHCTVMQCSAWEHWISLLSMDIISIKKENNTHAFLSLAAIQNIPAPMANLLQKMVDRQTNCQYSTKIGPLKLEHVLFLYLL